MMQQIAHFNAFTPHVLAIAPEIQSYLNSLVCLLANEGFN